MMSAQPLAQDFTIVWHNQDPEYYVEGCGLVQRDNGEWIAVIPVIPRRPWRDRRACKSLTHIVRSRDHGQTWEEISQLPYYSAVPWTHSDRLYLWANKGGTKLRNDDLLLLESRDGGASWSEPLLLFQGHFWNCDTGMVKKADRIYWAVDDLQFGQERGPRVIAGDLRAPMKHSSWRMSNPVPFPGFPESFVNPAFAGKKSKYLEPNVVNVYGQLQVHAAVKPKGQSTAGIAAVFDASDQGNRIELTFRQYHPMPGGQLKFCILWDSVSKLFWATANLAYDNQGLLDTPGATAEPKHNKEIGGRGSDRRLLFLLYSLDCLNWFQAGCIAKAAKLSQSFMYARPRLDGDDLVLISRSNIAGPNRHDADHATFHRIRGFRRLAFDLLPADNNGT